MAMLWTKVWDERIRHWQKTLLARVYVRLGDLPVEFATTRDLLTPAAAAAELAWRPIAPSTQWGDLWEYGWFRAELAVPAAATGKRLIAVLDTGCEMLTWVDGAVRVERWDADHPHGASPNLVTLSRQAETGRVYRILGEGLGGKGSRGTEGGPVRPGVDSIPDLGRTQATFRGCHYGIWRDAVMELWMDVEVLDGLRQTLPESSLRRAAIDRALADYTLTLDGEADDETFLATVASARAVLAPLLAARNGDTMVTNLAIGHGHLDVAWLWPLDETRRKIARTLGQQLTIAETHPEHRFLQPQPVLYQLLKDHYPEFYARVVAAVKAGTIVPEGGSWLEPDTNLSGGEALIRSCLYGKRFFREEFGVDSRIFWLPDVFGYSAALPQILRGCGIDYFVTSKLFWVYHGGDQVPYDTFTWVGLDGSTVKAHLITGYGSDATMRSLVQKSSNLREQGQHALRIHAYGYGDGGGGAREPHLQFLRRVGNLEGAPRIEIAHPLEFFRRTEAAGWPPERIVGELYLQIHRGTFTSQAAIKAGNRRSEVALREAECWAAAAGVRAGAAWPAATLERAWKEVLLNEFHDILPGSCIARVAREAEAGYGRAIAAATEIRDAACARLAGAGDGLSVFNSLAWERDALVTLPAGWAGATTATGDGLVTQTVDGVTLAAVTVPAVGWTTLRPAPAGRRPRGGVRATPTSLENEHLAAVFDDRGRLTSLIDRDSGLDWIAGPANEFRLFRDIPCRYDAWDLDPVYPLSPVDLPEPATIEVAAAGPLLARLRLTRRINCSTVEQIITLRRGARQLDFATTVDWRETHKLLKVAFPLHLHAEEALHEIQFGHVARPTHRNRQYDRDRFEVCNHRWTALVEAGRGAAVINDCKYGVDALDHTISLSLLRSPMAPEQHADRGRQCFTYALYCWNGPFLTQGPVRAGHELNVPVVTVAGGAGTTSLLSLDAPNIVVEAIKLAEDHSGDLILRLYECARNATRCRLRINLPHGAAVPCDLLENPVGDRLPTDGDGIALTFRAFEIKTLRLPRR
jgi:alpha-mannosidase